MPSWASTIRGRFSAFWWQRIGAFLLRQVHRLLAWKPRKAFLFVDDLLRALIRDSASEMSLCGAVLLRNCCAHFVEKGAAPEQPHLVCWEINFSHDTIQLVSAKLMKLDALIKALLGSKRVLVKTLEQCTHLLVLGHQHCLDLDLG